ncbi:helix-turn-helix transcriptional regulator [Amycolatopsis vancoresmycina]|uniref:helix-turn-helix transcriptional regulator n=1 Tax=Amycolatopsis vancoresmycina TaxID=208444 RepID=UPI0003AAF2FB|nr:helix-turn-helix transcriptional regulator [Amycolatopsis vancoresmycina]
MRSTREMRRLAAVLLAGAEKARFYPEDLRHAAQVHSNRLYPMLDKLKQRGWLKDEWDEPDKIHRYFVLTDDGRRGLAKPL